MSKPITSDYHFPHHYPMNYSGKLTTKVVMKKDYKRADGSCALYVQVFLNKERKRFPCDVAVKPEEFDDTKQRIKKGHTKQKDLNLIIEKMLGDFNRIEVNFRLANRPLTIAKLEYEYKNPSSRMDFIVFWEEELKRQEKLLKLGSWKQQTSSLNKLKTFRDKLFFYEITDELLEDIQAYLKIEKKNEPVTVMTFVKNFKKYLRIARKRGIVTPLDPDDISVKRYSTHRTFLNKNELHNLDAYFRDPYITPHHKRVLSKFLFSCNTGLRFTDVEQLTENNFIDGYLVWTAEKTTKVQRISITDGAKQYARKSLLLHKGDTNQFINRELKDICKIRNIKKHVSFHVARHTFATNFLIAGGRVENLQHLLGHSDIKETMIYVHIVESMVDDQIHNMSDYLAN